MLVTITPGHYDNRLDFEHTTSNSRRSFHDNGQVSEQYTALCSIPTHLDIHFDQSSYLQYAGNPVSHATATPEPATAVLLILGFLAGYGAMHVWLKVKQWLLSQYSRAYIRAMLENAR
jgi:hypothetical protein